MRTLPVDEAQLDRPKPLRTLIHVSGLTVILIRRFLGSPITLALIAAVSLLYMLSEIYRLKGRHLPLTRITFKAARGGEKERFIVKPLYYALGVGLSLLLFPVGVGDSAIIFLTVGDGLAGVTGVLGGATPLPFQEGKTVEGSLIGFTAALLLASFFLPVEIAFFGAFVGALVEGYGRGMDDNLTVPLSTGFALWALTLIIPPP